tara:strand:+ start:338 stop:619 length:282 start_codon:yes stop_codon:yes gene_type:complete
MNIQDYAHNINEIVSNNKVLFSRNGEPEFDLINLARPLREISQLNKKYSLVNFDQEFFDALDSFEKESFLENVVYINNLLMNFFANYHLKNNL